MPEQTESESRKLLGRLRETMAEESAGQARLDQIVQLIATSMGTEVCSIYLFRDAETLELCATEGLNAAAVHQTRLRVGEGLVGRVARTSSIINTADAPSEKGFRFMPETGEEVYSSFLGVPIQRVGDKLGVLVVQSKTAREYTSDEIYGLEVVAMVLAEMTELGAFIEDGGAMGARHQHAMMIRGTIAQEGAAKGHVWLHEPRVMVTNPFADNPEVEHARLNDAVEQLRVGVDKMLKTAATSDGDHLEVLEAFRMFANSKGWMRRMQEDINRGLSAEAAVEKEQSAAKARMQQVTDAYLRDRLHDLDDLSNRLLRILTGQGKDTGAQMPADPILIARNIGPAELLDYGRSLRGIILEEGSVGSHAAIVARALAIPLIVHADGILTEALNGDQVLVDGDQGIVHLRPDDSVASAFSDKILMHAAAQERYASIRDTETVTACGTRIHLKMNAGLLADLPSIESSGAEGVGLFRTELQFLIRNKMPKRTELSELYARIINSAKGKPVIFRTLDIGSDKVLPFMRHVEEPNPALGWRAIRVGLDKPGVLRMQLQALIRAAKGGPLQVMFPFIAEHEEFKRAKVEFMAALEAERKLKHPLPSDYKLGAMLEMPSLAFASDAFFKDVDFISIGGNDLKQFFFAADRENELVRRRYDTLSPAFLRFLHHIVKRCETSGTSLSFCGEDAGRPIEAMALAALGITTLSMRPASIGPVKNLLLQADLTKVRKTIELGLAQPDTDLRQHLSTLASPFLKQIHK